MPCTVRGSANETLLRVRESFPCFSEKPGVLFLDNASTSQKPQGVIATIEQFYRNECANAGRALYSESIRASQSIEKARLDIARFINARPMEVSFTAGATDSLNAVAWSWGLTNLQDGDEVLVCMQDHAAAVLPWQRLAQTLANRGVFIRVIPFEIHAVGDYDLRSIQRNVSDKTRVIALSHVHHVFGLEMEVKEIRKLVGDDVIISLDAAQSIGHTQVDVQDLNVDFLSFSGHKMFAGNGAGVLFAAQKRHRELSSFRSGGQANPFDSEIDENSRSAFIHKIECGTPNIPSIASLSAAVQFIEQVGLQNIEAHVSHLTEYLIERISVLPGIEFGPGPVTCGCPGGFGILSFRFEQASTMDIASALAAEDIHVRAGTHCRVDKTADDLIRVSLHVYNNQSDIDVLVETLRGLLE